MDNTVKKMRLVSLCTLALVTALPTPFPTEDKCRWCEELRAALQEIVDTVDSLRVSIDKMAENHYSDVGTYTYDSLPGPLMSKLTDDTFWNTSDVGERLEALDEINFMWSAADLPEFWNVWGGRVELCVRDTKLRATALQLYREILFEMPDREGFFQTTQSRFVLPYLTDQDAYVRHIAQGIVDVMSRYTYDRW